MGAAWGDRCEQCPARGSAGFSSLCADAGLGPGGADVDECAALPDLCGANGQCVNAMGSYRCLCDRGFAPTADGAGCRDVDECRDGRSRSGRNNELG